MKLRAITILLLLTLPATAQYQAPPAPIAGVYSHDKMRNVATLYVTYCMKGLWPCKEYRVEAWGQVCDPHLARQEAKINRVNGTVLPGMEYASWRCSLADPNDKPPDGTSGNADEWPDMPAMPSNFKSGGITKSEAVSLVEPSACHVLNAAGHPIKS